MIGVSRREFGHLRAVIVAACILSMAVLSRPAAASHDCVSWHDTNVNLLIDYSGSMAGDKAGLARDFGLGVLDELSSVGHLSRAGGIGFPIPPSGPGWDYEVTAGNRSIVRNRIATTSSNGNSTPLYNAIVIGANYLGALSVSGRKILIVITDGENFLDINGDGVITVAGDGYSVNRSYAEARTALQHSDAWNYLVFAGSSSTPGAATLQSLAADSGSQFRLATSGTSASSLVSDVLAQACRNFRPHASLSLSDSNLQLGIDGFEITFDASGSSDRETSDSSLSYQWTFSRPDGSTFTRTGMSFTESFDDSQLPAGTGWTVELVVTDASGATDTDSASFQVVGSPPEISLSGGDIDVLQDLSVRADPGDDVDNPGGGGMTFEWTVTAAPVGAQHSVGATFAGQTLDFTTMEGDIGDWAFECTATDNEGDTDTESISLAVNNLPPEINLVGSNEIDISDTIQVETTELDDPDNAMGGGLTFKWDIIQAPASSATVVQENYSGTSMLTIPTGYDDAGTWIFRLTVTDDEDPPWQEEVSEEFTVLVDAPPEAVVTGPPVVGSLSLPVTLSAEDSLDPDSPCVGDAFRCHETLDGGLPSDISPDIVEYTWTLLDVPYDLIGVYSIGRVDDALGVPARNSTLTLDTGDIEPGEWIFQVEVIDGEGNTDSTTVSLVVIEEGGPPIALALPPFSRYLVNPIGNTLLQDVGLTGAFSFDLDNILSGDVFSGGLGIDNYAWSINTPPSGCVPPGGTSGPSEELFTPYSVGDVVDPSCQGYFEVGLEVTDDDSSPKTDTTSAYISIGNCPGVICVDLPTTANPEIVEYTDQTDVLIFYHLDSTVYENPFFSAGMFARLRIFHQDDPSTAFYKDYDPNVLASNRGDILVFKWDGRGSGGERPRAGRYSVQIDLVDFGLNPSSFSDQEPDSILIAVAEPTISAGSEEYAVREALEAGADTLDILFDVDGGATVDELRWQVLDASDTPVVDGTLPSASSGNFSWDGRDGTGTVVAAGKYRVRISALRGGGLLGESALHEVTVFRVDIDADTDRSGSVEDVADETGEDNWVKTLGSIFNVNLDRDGGRTDLGGGPIPDAVHFTDGGDPTLEDLSIENAADEADITPFVIRGPGAELPPSLRVFLTVPEREDIQSVHVYKHVAAGETAIWGSLGDRIGGAPEPLELDITDWVNPGSPDYQGSGPVGDITFGLEGMLFRFVGASATIPFDGEVDFTLEVRDGGGAVVATDDIRLKVAPWTMLPHTLASIDVWAYDAGVTNEKFRLSASADPGYVGIDDSGQLQTVVGLSAASQWFQDHVEIGYYERPGGNKDHAVFRLPYGAQPEWPREELLAAGVALFQLGGDLAGGAGDFGGNVELIPPTPSHPLGRIVVGDTRSDALWDFLVSQEVQDPIEVPTQWLLVSHVDEVFGFTPTANEVIVASPDSAYTLLNAIPAAERGGAVFFATGAQPEADVASADATTNTRLETGVDHTGASWAYVRLYDDSASGSGAAGQVARISTLGNGFIEVDKVWDTPLKIIPDGASGSSVKVDAVENEAPSQGTWFANPQTGDKYVLVEGTRFWFESGHPDGHGTPAIITAEEVLADSELEALNLVDIQNKIDGIKTALNTAAGGGLAFIEVPTIYLGERAGFDTNRNSVAYTPGNSNFQLINGTPYFPRQFGPRDTGSGNDIFEAAVRSAVPTAEFVDDWDLYHRLDGEVHCGTNVVRQTFGLDWWSNQP